MSGLSRDAAVWPKPPSVYVHVPFCRRRCPYCDFTVVAGRDDLVDDYLRAIQRELSWLGGPHAVETIYFGGGTPSHLKPDRLARLLACVRERFLLEPNHEWSVEANPIDVDEARGGLLAEHGVNRLSLGAQSLDAGKLALLGRDHDAGAICRAFERARRRFASVSLDLIFAVPGESLACWQADLRAALRLQPDHISTYCLAFERGTAYWSRRRKGQLQELPDAAQREMFELAIDQLTAAGYEHYEISNFARPGHRCRHNEYCWLYKPYFGVGPGAARFVDGRRETNHRSTTTYLKRVLSGRSPVAEQEQLEPEAAARERLVLGLRRREGVDARQFAGQTGFAIEQLLGPLLQQFADQGLWCWTAGRLRLTRHGLMLSDSIWAEVLAPEPSRSERCATAGARPAR